MIAITDISAFPDLEIETLGTNLTTDIVNQYILGSIVVNAAITTAVRALLNSVITNTVDLQINTSLSRLAGYAGFTTSSNGAITFNSENISLDKLTFYVIFRLPFSSTYLQYQNPLPVSSSLALGSVKGWGKYSNYIRSLAGSGLKQLNETGVDFDLGAEYFTTLNGYNSVSGIYPDDSISEYQTTLFNHSQDYNKLPISYFRLAQDENPYSNFYKKRKYFKPHWPDDVSIDNNIDKSAKRVYFERQISGYRLGANNTHIPINNDDISVLYLERILQASIDGYHTLEVGNKIYNLKLLEEDDTFFKLINCEIIFYDENNNEIKGGSYKGIFKIIARKYDPARMAMPMAKIKDKYTDDRRYFIELYKNAISGSGLTFGAGIDIGAAFVKTHEKSIRFTISFSGSVSQFKLGIGRHTIQLSYSAANISANIKNAIDSLLTLHLIGGAYSRMKNSSKKSSDFISVKKIENANKYEITIDAPIAYLKPNFIFSPTSSVEIMDETNAASIRVGFKKSWIKLKTILLRSFDVVIPSFSNEDEEFNWLDSNMSCYTESGILNLSEQHEFQSIIKSLIGVQAAMSWVQFRNNFFLIRKFEFGVGLRYVNHLRALYNEFYLENYLKPAFSTTGFRSKINIGSGTSPTIEQAKKRLNEAEIYVLVSCQYNQGSLKKLPYDLMAKAVNSHDHSLLKQVVNKIPWAGAAAGSKNPRAILINKFIDKCKVKLYHDVD